MPQIDLDDLPPRVAKALEGLGPGDELVLVRGGVMIARLTASQTSTPAAADPPAEQDMKEVMEQFNAMIHDEF